MKQAKTSATPFFAGQDRWFLFDRYELEFDDDGFPVAVRPEKGTSLRWYRPFDKYPQLLVDYLQLAEDIASVPFGPAEAIKADKSRGKWMYRANLIREFVGKYGQLGVLWECATSFETVSKTVTVALSPACNSYTLPGFRHGSVSFAEFVRFFHRDDVPIERVISYDPKFLAEYREPLATIVRDAEDLHRIASEWQSLKEIPTRKPKVGWGYLSRPSASGVTLTVHIDDSGPRLDYHSRSLIGALRIMLTLNSASAGQNVRMCALAECRRPFIAKDGRGRYCLESHSNRDRQRTFQQKQLKKGKKNGRSSSRKGKK